MGNAVRILEPHPAAVDALASIPLIESYGCPRGSILHVKRSAFMDAPTVPALVMHPIDYQSLQVSAETGRPMRDLDVQFEGLRRHIANLIERRAARAIRRIERMHPNHTDGSRDA